MQSESSGIYTKYTITHPSGYLWATVLVPRYGFEKDDPGVIVQAVDGTTKTITGRLLDTILAYWRRWGYGVESEVI